MTHEQIHLLVSGHVQGVGFRYATVSEARRYKLTGWVRNLPDQTVEILAQGPPDLLIPFLEWCYKGPPQSQVEKVTVVNRQVLNERTFLSFEIVR